MSLSSGASEHQAYDGMTLLQGDTPVLLMGPYQPNKFKIEAGHPLEVSTQKMHDVQYELCSQTKCLLP